jgi:hypothetical protein
LPEQIAGRVKFAKVGPPIHRINISGRIHRAIPGCGVGDDLHDVAVLVQLLDAPVFQVGHVEESLGVNGDAPGQVELAGMAGALIVGKAAVKSQEIALGIIFLNPVIALVHNVHVPLGIQGHAADIIEPPLVAADQVIDKIDCIVTLDGTGSKDANNDKLNYLWSVTKPGGKEG